MIDLSAYKLSESLSEGIEWVTVNETKLFRLKLIDSQSFNSIELELKNKKKDKIINTRGLYFWTFHYNKEEYKLYIGKADPKARDGIIDRLLDYFKDYLVASPNDYKIRHFNTYISGKLNDITYSVYCYYYFDRFKYPANKSHEEVVMLHNMSRQKLNMLEKSLIKQYEPLLNNVSPNKEDLKRTSQKVYDAKFDRKFRVRISGSNT